jgi:hypothetical protein
MGYYNYQRGLIYHHLDEAGSWNSHLKNCRNFIIKALAHYNPTVVTVLGSGWLLDLPLNEINDTAKEINLVDIVHPPEVRDQVENLPKVILREEDVTGGLIEKVWKKASGRTFLNKLRSIDDIVPGEYCPSFDPGLIISLNVLTQLESLPAEFLKKHSRVDEESLKRFRKSVQQNHIFFLKKHDSVLITDISEIISDKTGNRNHELSLLVELPESEFRDEWTWDFESRNPEFYSRRSVYRVAAMAF